MGKKTPAVMDFIVPHSRGDTLDLTDLMSSIALHTSNIGVVKINHGHVKSYITQNGPNGLPDLFIHWLNFKFVGENFKLSPGGRVCRNGRFMLAFQGVQWTLVFSGLDDFEGTDGSSEYVIQYQCIESEETCGCVCS